MFKVLIVLLISSYSALGFSMSFVSFQKTVASSGTPEAVGASTLQVMSGVIQAKVGNTGNITLIQKGGTYGTVLTPGQAYNLSLSGISGKYDLSQIYIKVATNGDGIDFTGFVD